MIIEKLQQLGFEEGVDFSFENNELQALEKTRMVEQEIEHPAVEAVFEEQEILDEENNSFDPPQFEQVEISPAVEAYTEIIEVEETYLAPIPSLQDLKSMIIADHDVALLVNEYLSDKQDLLDEDDSINIVNGSIYTWGFKNIPAPSVDELFDLIQPTQAKQDQEVINRNALKFLAETDWYVTRFSETNTPIPEEILNQRQAARDSIIR